MANQKSALKRIRSDETKRLRNRYQMKTCRTFIKELKRIKGRQEAEVLFKKVVAMLDKLVKRNIIHKNKAAHSKSTLSKRIRSLA